jgi:hypothetical protein
MIRDNISNITTRFFSMTYQFNQKWLEEEESMIATETTTDDSAGRFWDVSATIVPLLPFARQRRCRHNDVYSTE